MGDESDTPAPDGRMLNRTVHLWRATPVEHEPRGTAGSGVPEAIRVWLLGGFRFSVGFRAVEENRWRLKKAASLVKLLTLAPYYKMHRERVTHLLWPNPEAEAATYNLHRTVTILVSVISIMVRVPAAEGASMTLWLENERVSTSYSKTVWRR